MEPPILIHRYLGDYPATLDAKRVRLMKYSLRHQVQYQRGLSRLSATASWARRWAYCGGLGVLSTEDPRADLEMSYVGMDEGAVYARKIVEILDDLDSNPRTELLHRYFSAYYYTYDRLWFV